MKTFITFVLICIIFMSSLSFVWVNKVQAGIFDNLISFNNEKNNYTLKELKKIRKKIKESQKVLNEYSKLRKDLKKYNKKISNLFNF